jgi:hypothetical protein
VEKLVEEAKTLTSKRRKEMTTSSTQVLKYLTEAQSLFEMFINDEPIEIKNWKPVNVQTVVEIAKMLQLESLKGKGK